MPRSCIWLDETNYQPIGSAAQMWTVTLHQCGITVLVSKTSFRRVTSGGVAKCRLFSLASSTLLLMLFLFCIFFFKFGVLNVTAVLMESRNVIPAVTGPQFSSALRQWIDATWEKLRKKNLKTNWTEAVRMKLGARYTINNVPALETAHLVVVSLIFATAAYRARHAQFQVLF